MQLILDIEENQKDVVLNIIKNLKDGIIKSYTLKESSKKSNIEVVCFEEEREIKEILNTMSSDDKQIVDSRKYNINLWVFVKKKLEINYTKKADKFLAKNINTISKNDVDILIIKSVRKIFNYDESINIDLKKMSTIDNCFRIRKGDIRILFFINETDELIVSIVEMIGYRGDVYKKYP